MPGVPSMCNTWYKDEQLRAAASSSSEGFLRWNERFRARTKEREIEGGADSRITFSPIWRKVVFVKSWMSETARRKYWVMIREISDVRQLSMPLGYSTGTNKRSRMPTNARIQEIFCDITWVRAKCRIFKFKTLWNVISKKSYFEL